MEIALLPLPRQVLHIASHGYDHPALRPAVLDPGLPWQHDRDSIDSGGADLGMDADDQPIRALPEQKGQGQRSVCQSRSARRGFTLDGRTGPGNTGGGHSQK